MSNWQPMDTAPKDGTEVIGYDALGVSDIGSVAIIHWSKESDCWLDQTFDCFTLTHWMPLPNKPEETK